MRGFIKVCFNPQDPTIQSCPFRWQGLQTSAARISTMALLLFLLAVYREYFDFGSKGLLIWLQVLSESCPGSSLKCSFQWGCEITNGPFWDLQFAWKREIKRRQQRRKAVPFGKEQRSAASQLKNCGEPNVDNTHLLCFDVKKFHLELSSQRQKLERRGYNLSWINSQQQKKPQPHVFQ